MKQSNTFVFQGSFKKLCIWWHRGLFDQKSSCLQSSKSFLLFWNILKSDSKCVSWVSKGREGQGCDEAGSKPWRVLLLYLWIMTETPRDILRW